MPADQEEGTMQQTDSLLKVAEGIYQVQLPLPFALKIVNCYLLDDGDGAWTIVDTGLNYYADQEVWGAAFDALGIQPSNIRRIVLTHNHPDHYGLAGWLQAQSGAPVQMSKIEADGAQMFWIDAESHRAAITEEFHHAGAPADVVEEIIQGVGYTIAMTAPHPTRVEHIAPGEMVRFGGRSFTPILAPGHSDGQLIFYDAADKLLLSGDHVLLKITPVVGLWPESERQPLARFLASLRDLRDLDVRLALPGHKALITDWRGRIDELIAHHDERLERTMEAVSGGATAFQVAGALFNLQRLSVHDMRFALVETLAHLEYLVDQGAIRQSDDDIWRFET
jgi:glyoxylase-like metal-dependent hydrolase (beta-lactamase superfamily II)